jgi:hypothetical protein
MRTRLIVAWPLRIAHVCFSGVIMLKHSLCGFGLCVLGVATLAGGCAMQDKKNEQHAESMPINCATSEGDIRMLEGEKASTAQKVGAGISMVAPVGLVVGLVTSTEGTKYQVTTGEYNTMLDKKIAEIKQTCGVT